MLLQSEDKTTLWIVDIGKRQKKILLTCKSFETINYIFKNKSKKNYNNM